MTNATNPQAEIKIEIISGEGTGDGHTHLWTASLHVPSIRRRLTKERCRGDRWAFCRVNGLRVDDDDIGDAILMAQGR